MNKLSLLLHQLASSALQPALSTKLLPQLRQSNKKWFYAFYTALVHFAYHLEARLCWLIKQLLQNNCAKQLCKTGIQNQNIQPPQMTPCNSMHHTELKITLK
uniref:Putative secreted protein n=1 Tax=Amblyomma triste TaxID=251400 RepID=A0A023G0E0_AMBTT